jgi:ligand-binding SRPBCC domain-containing protein
MAVRIQIDIQRPTRDVFAFASDVANLPFYDKGILEVKKITDGPIGAGTTFNLLTRQLGILLTVVLVFTAYEPNRQFSYKVISGPFPVETHYNLTGLNSGTRVSVEREPQARDLWKWLIPLVTIPARQKLYVELNGLILSGNTPLKGIIRP